MGCIVIASFRSAQPMLESNKNHSLQWLRAVAASMVVLAHLIERLIKYNLVSAAWEDATRLGSKGVDIFFVISGFIVGAAFLGSLTRGEGSLTFFKKRLLRIAPPYYFWSLWMALKSVLIDGQVVTWAVILTSAAFVPQYNDIGIIQPLYGLGWSLNFEMYFYAVLALGVLIGRGGVSVLLVFGLILIPVLWRACFGDIGESGEVPVAIDFYGMPVALYFLAGLTLAIFKKRFTVFFVCRSAAAVMVVAVAFSVLSVLFKDALGVFFTFASVAVAALESRVSGSGSQVIRFGSFLGDASYSTYLTHSFILGPLVAVYRSTVKLDSTIGVFVLILCSVVLCNLVGALAYVHVEKRLNAFVHWLSARRRRPRTIG